MLVYRIVWYILLLLCFLQGEFLVNAGSFGITTTTSGMSNVRIIIIVSQGFLEKSDLSCPLSQRPPIEWGSECQPKSATYVFPYIVAWSQEVGIIRVYNLIHQRCVQEIPFSVSTCCSTNSLTGDSSLILLLLCVCVFRMVGILMNCLGSCMLPEISLYTSCHLYLSRSRYIRASVCILIRVCYVWCLSGE